MASAIVSSRASAPPRATSMHATAASTATEATPITIVQATTSAGVQGRSTGVLRSDEVTRRSYACRASRAAVRAARVLERLEPQAIGANPHVGCAKSSGPAYASRSSGNGAAPATTRGARRSRCSMVRAGREFAASCSPRERSGEGRSRALLRASGSCRDEARVGRSEHAHAREPVRNHNVRCAESRSHARAGAVDESLRSDLRRRRGPRSVADTSMLDRDRARAAAHRSMHRVDVLSTSAPPPRSPRALELTASKPGVVSASEISSNRRALRSSVVRRSR